MGAKYINIKKTLRKIVLLITIVYLFMHNSAIKVYASNKNYFFEGSGTINDPYLINNKEQLKLFRDLVNSGNDLKEIWFKQTSDIDLDNEDWEPIGIVGSDKHFYGYYNGDGHVIHNFVIRAKNTRSDNYGFFGELAGYVFNLGLEDGVIEGNNVGSIASTSATGTRPIIANCYSTLTLVGNNVGGIAYDFDDGLIANCYYQNKHSETNEEISLTNKGLIVGNNNKNNYYSYIEDIYQESKIINSECKWIMYACASGIKPEMFVELINNDEKTYFTKDYLTVENIEFEGQGTKESPFLIKNYNDLSLLRFYVNTGNRFYNQFFKQTTDIKIMDKDWMPIGLYNSKHYFAGLYDGNGKKLINLTSENHHANSWDNTGLFGQLGGVIANLSVTNVSINGNYCGVIAFCSVMDDGNPVILNCFTQGEVSGLYASGIVDRFDQGLIAGCITDVLLNNVTEYSDDYVGIVGGIICHPNNVKVYSNLSTSEILSANDHLTDQTFNVSISDIDNDKSIFLQNIKLALVQELFANHYNVNLMQIESFDNSIPHFNGNNILSFVSFINEYILVFVLIGILFYYIYLIKNNKNNEVLKEVSISFSIIFGIVSLFVDCAIIGHASITITIGRVLFVIISNTMFLLSLIYTFKNYIRIERINVKLLIGAAVLLLLSISQLDTVPRYDAHLYYGSFVKGCNIFNLDLLTYLGSFASWGPHHRSSVLLLAPLEFLLPGKMIGVTIATITIAIVTYFVLYRLLSELFPKISDTIVIMVSATLLLMPYQLAMVSYLSYDNLCTYIAVWFIYCYKHKYNILVSFFGYLLMFTKITGGVFYYAFLFIFSLYEIYQTEGKNILNKFINWINIIKCALWLLPGIAYLILNRLSGWLVMQSFLGKYSTSDLITIKGIVSYLNTLFQAYIFGFRWLMLLIALYICINVINSIRKHSVNNITTTDMYVVSTVFASSSCILLLLLYNGNAECPRYTSIMNISYIMLIIKAISLLKRKTKQIVISLFVTAIFLIQTFKTIDPSIIINNHFIDTGNNILYSLSFANDERDSMNLYKDTGYGTVSDLFAYNREYDYCNSLINKSMIDINPDSNTKIYVLDITEYEFHLQGMQYRIYWNTGSKSFSYKKDNDNFIVNGGRITTQQIVDSINKERLLGKEFYIIVPTRINTDYAFDCLKDDGYIIDEQHTYKNMYGTIFVYHFNKTLETNALLTVANK